MDIFLQMPQDDLLRETIAAQLHALGFGGSLEEDAGLHCYIEKEGWTEDAQKRLQSVVSGRADRTVAIGTITELPNRDWNREWEESLRPIAVTERIVIAPSWHPLPSDGTHTVLVIDPKMSFGTGHHESTRIMLRLLERYLLPDAEVLDVGTGTGILAIAAVKLGAKSSVAVDTDEWSYENAKENVIRNNLSGRVDVRLGSLDVVGEREFTVVLANINRNVVLELLPSMLRLLRTDGVLMLSGLLSDDRPVVEKSLERYGCIVADALTEREWTGIVARRTRR